MEQINNEENALKEQNDALRPLVDYSPKSGRLDKKAVEELKRFRLEIAQNHPSATFEDSVELLRQIREDRMRELEQR